jgi:nitroreductase
MTDTMTNERIAFLRGLRAVRAFRPDPVPQDALDAILDVARWSGSASNRQPWELVIVRDPATKQALTEVEGYLQHLASAPLGIVLVMNGVPDKEEQEIYDEGRLCERIMLAASAYGLGSCIGWLVGEGVSATKSLLGIPEQRRVKTIISIGYPDEEALRSRPKRPQARKPLSEIVHEDRYA